jgi:hypothetical protein
VYNIWATWLLSPGAADCFAVLALFAASSVVSTQFTGQAWSMYIAFLSTQIQ